MKERRRSEKRRLESLLRISQYRADSVQEFLDFALSEAIALTGSELGYICLYDEQTRRFIVNTWSKGAMDACRIPDPQTTFELGTTGLWGEAVRQAKPFMINDYSAPHPLKKGYPKGHAPLVRFMTLPVTNQGEIVAVLGLANKPVNYTDADVHQASLLMASVWQMAERKKAEDALIRSERRAARLAAIVNASGDAIIGATPEGLITDWNPGAEEIYGYARQDILGHPFTTLIAPEGRQQAAAMIEAIRKSRHADRQETLHLRKNGQVFYASVSASVMLDNQDRLSGLSFISRDVSQRKKKEAELQRYRDFIENISDGCFETDLAGKITYANEAAGRHMGRSPQTLMGIKNRDCSNSEESRRALAVFQKIYDTGQPAIIDDFIIYDDSDQPRHLELAASLIRDSQGQPIGFRATTRDKSEHFRMQEVLKLNEARYRKIFQDSKAVMLLIDPDNGSIADANEAACLFYGYPRERLLSLKITDINVLNKKEVFEEMEKARFQGRNHFYFRHRLADGDIRPVEVFSSVIAVEAKQMLFSIIHDISARIEAENALRSSEEKYRNILTGIHDGYFELDLAGNFTFANEAACDILGYELREIVGMNYRRIASPQTAARMLDVSNLTFRTGIPSSLLDYEIIRKDGSIRLQEMNTGLIRDSSGAPVGFHVMARDITEKRKAEEALRQGEERIRLLFNNIPVPTFVWRVQDDDFILAEFNASALQFIGSRIIDFVGKPAALFFRRMPQIPSDIRQCLNLRRTVENQFWYVEGDETDKRYVIIKYAFAPPDSVLMHVNDITGQKRAEEDLQYISVHDSLTGLFNRFYADAEIKRLAASRLRPISVIVIDLNDLKKVNDEQGHAAGDLYIRNTATLLKQTFRPEDMAARIGGDEFLILLPEVDEPTCAQAITRLHENLFRFNQRAAGLPLSLSAGWATACREDNLMERIREADARMYREKALIKAVCESSGPH